MKKYYSIGEVSDILGISTQTLRYYDKIGVAKPMSVDPNTSYRRYSYDQIHLIERIKYLQNLGLALDDIKSALSDGEIKNLVSALEKQEKKVEYEMLQRSKTLENIKWYIKYFKYLENNFYPEIPFKQYVNKRYVLAAPFNPGEPLYGSAGYRLTAMKGSETFRNVKFMRQNGYILDFKCFMSGAVKPLAYFMYLHEKPDFEHINICEFPSGEYICIRGKLLTEQLDLSLIQQYFKDSYASLVVADEYEDNLDDFQHCTYEIQILIKEY